MKALQLTAYAQPLDVALAEVSAPEPGAGQVRVRVRAAGLNPLDYKMAAGWMADAMPLQLPAVLGFDAAGRVDAVGSGVTRFAVGDKIFGMFSPRPGPSQSKSWAMLTARPSR